MPKKASVEIGEVYKSYTVVDNTPITKNNQTHFMVKCKCGKERLMNASQLKNPDRWFMCRECADKERFSDSRTTVGKFSQSFINKIKKSAEQRFIKFSDELTLDYL